MGAPPGNQYAIGNKGGRPRTVSPPPEELEKLGQDMIEYVSDKKNKVLHLSEWWSTKMFFVEKVWETIIRRDEFIPYYEQAMRIIGKQYIDKTSNVRDGISHRWQHVYFKDLKKEEIEHAKLLASISQANNVTATPEQVQKMEDFQSQLSTVSEALNNSRSNNSSEV